MIIERRISSAFREIPGGQILGPTLDYTQRILEPTLASENMESIEAFLDNVQSGINREELPRDNQLLSKVSDLLRKEGLMKAAEDEDKTLVDVTREPLRFPVPRSGRLQMLAMSQTGALLALGYSGQRGFGGGHGTVGELRVGRVPVPLTDRLGRRRTLGLIRVTEAEMITRIEVKKKNTLPHMVIGYGLCFGQNETKAISMGGIDRSMRRGNDDYPCQSQEFVLHHTAGVDAWGSLRSLMIPSHTAFASELQLLRSARMRSRQEQVPTHATESRFSTNTTPTEPSSS
jgi:alpha-D-ribose 1-methylphosphonate 5-triphosphate synthase subunit PhnI